MALADAKNRLSEVVERLEREHGRVVITKHGRPAVVVLSVEDLETGETAVVFLDTANGDEIGRFAQPGRSPGSWSATTTPCPKESSRCWAGTGRRTHAPRRLAQSGIRAT